jgi:hypothetical protein
VPGADLRWGLSVPKRDMDEPVNSDGEFEDVIRDLLNAGLVTFEEDEPEGEADT